MYGFRCQALVSLGPLSTPIKDKADRFPVQAVLHSERGVRDFGVLVRIGDDFFITPANLFKRQSGVSHGRLRFGIRRLSRRPAGMTESGFCNRRFLFLLRLRSEEGAGGWVSTEDRVRNSVGLERSVPTDTGRPPPGRLAYLHNPTFDDCAASSLLQPLPGPVDVDDG